MTHWFMPYAPCSMSGGGIMICGGDSLQVSASHPTRKIGEHSYVHLRAGGRPAEPLDDVQQRCVVVGEGAAATPGMPVPQP